MIKVFISQPMKNKTDIEIETEREQAIKELGSRCKLNDIEVLDTFFKNAPHDAKPLWFLGESIKLIDKADVVVFCKHWNEYNGCIIEHECAIRYNKDCIYL